jgi:hypothetical protein
MPSNAMKGLTVTVSIVVLFGLFMVLRDDAEREPAKTTAVSPPPGQAPSERSRGDATTNRSDRTQEDEVPVITVKGGQPVGGVQELTFESGAVIRFAVRSDLADEAHLHGYDVSKPVEPGGSETFELPADIEGVFELELEERGVPIAEISVVP